MPFFTRCPYCKHGVTAPDRALAGSAKCPACGSWYTAIPEERGPADARTTPTGGTRIPAPAPASTKPAPAPTEPASTGTAVATAPPLATVTAPAPVLQVVESSEVPEEESPAGKGGTSLIGVAVCFLAAAALITASFQSTAVYARPLAGVGLILGIVAALAIGSERPARLALPVGGAVVSGLALFVAWFIPSLLGPGYEASRAKSDYDPDAIRTVPLQLTPTGVEAPDPTGPVDASRFALQQGFIRVQITGASVAPVQVVDSKKRFTKQPFLAVTVRVQHLGHGERFRFVHWDTTGERTVPAAIATADGRKLGAANVGRDVALGVTFGEDVFPGRDVDDLLLFESFDPIGAVRIELPAEAWGGRGSFRFQIPSSMIVTQPGKKPR